MKKLLLIMLCLITLTGCGNEVEQQPTESPTKQEEVEVNKYITIKLTLNEDCNTEKNDSCKVENFTIENDKDNIFKALDLNSTTYCDLYGNKCKDKTDKTNTLNKIYDIAIQNNMNLIPDYRYLTNEEFKTSREIILKPLDELKWDNKINLNENVLIQIKTSNYNEYEESCVINDKEFGKEIDPQRCGPVENGYSGGIKKKISDNLIEQIKSTPGRLYKEKFTDDLGYEEVIISDSLLLGNPRFYKESKYNLLGEYPNEYGWDGGYKTLYNEDIKSISRNTLNISRGMDINYRVSYEYKILDEKICEEYNLVCDRW